MAQSALEGVSFAHTFDDAAAPTKHHTQYFEMFAHRAIYHDGWRAVCPFPGTSFAEAGVSFGQLELSEDKLRELDATGWELYHVEVDPAETKDLAEQERAKLIEMIALWYTEAGKYNVLPLDSRGTMRFADPRPQLAAARDTYVYFPGTQSVPENVAVKVLNRAHAITVDAEFAEGDEGVLACHGSNVGGYVLFVQDGKLHYVHNYVGAEELEVSSDGPMPAGRHALRYEFEPTGPPDLMAGKGTPGIGEALRRRRAGGPGGAFGDGAAGVGAWQRFRRGPQPRFGDVGAVQLAVPVHRHDLQGDGGRVRQARPRRGGSQEGRGAGRHGAAVNSERLTMTKASKKTAPKKKAAAKKAAPKKAAATKAATEGRETVAAQAFNEPHLAREQLPIPDAKHVGLTTYDAKDPNTKYPPIKELRPPAGAPNVLIVLIDDVGFGASSAFGGPCNTPVAERLAAGGVKLNRFHTTALCSPTRQAC